MSKTRDKHPELDYYELRRRHEEFKNRARSTPVNNDNDLAQEPINIPEPVEPIPDFSMSADDISEDTAPVEQSAAEPAFEEIIDEDNFDENALDGDFDEDYADDDPDMQKESDNPFASLLSFARRVKNRISEKRDARLMEEDLTDEELAYLEGLDDEPEAEQPAAKRALFNRRKNAQLDEPAFDDPAEIDSIDDDRQIEDIEEPSEYEFGSDYPVDGADDYFDEDEEFIDDEPSEESGFKRFMKLFITRIDDDVPADDEFVEEIPADDFDDFSVVEVMEEETPIEAEPVQNESSIRNRAIGGKYMEDMNKPVAEKAAAEAESMGMSRRERRELAMRLAAEEAARKAAEEAAEAAKKAALLKFDDEPEGVDMAAFKSASEEPVIESSVKDVVEDFIVDEPTRVFERVNTQTEEGLSSLFDVEDGSEPVEEEEEVKPRKGLFGRKRAVVPEEDESDESKDDEDDDEDEDDDRPARRSRGLFGRRSRASDEEDEDEGEEDEDEDEDDEDEEDDEDDRPARRSRGLFGRRSRASDEEDEDEDDEDDEDSYDDDDEDDEYDEYDDEDEDEDEEEDDDEYFEEDESRRSFGHHLIGIFKVLLSIILVLLVAVIVLNFLYAGGHAGIVDTLHDRMDDSAAFNMLFPAYSIQKNLATEAPAEPEIIDNSEALPASEEEAIEPDAVEPDAIEPEVPDFDDGSLSIELPDIDVEAAEEPVEEAPTAEEQVIPESVG